LIRARFYSSDRQTKEQPKMSDATNSTGQQFTVPPGVMLKDKTVNVVDLNPLLQSFLVTAGLVHMHLFNQLLVVTSGKDGAHSPGSKHDRGNAVDLRVNDLLPSYQPAFLLLLRVLCDRFHLAMFDESFVPGAGHVHIETTV
jgi:hypothetical protein